MPGLDTNTKLLIHCNGTDGSTSFTDESASNHSITAVATAQVDTQYKKFGTGSVWFDGNSDYLSIPDSTDWDVCGSNTDDWTIDFWTRHANAGDSYHVYIEHREDSGNKWHFYHSIGGGLIFALRTGASNVIILSSGVSIRITDTNWHHVALIKKADEYGIYLDGTQVAYVQDSSTDTFTGSLYIGVYNLGDYMNGNMDEIRIQKNNYFNASPNNSKTDTITVPISEYSAPIIFNLRKQAIIIS